MDEQKLEISAFEVIRDIDRGSGSVNVDEYLLNLLLTSQNKDYVYFGRRILRALSDQQRNHFTRQFRSLAVVESVSKILVAEQLAKTEDIFSPDKTAEQFAQSKGRIIEQIQERYAESPATLKEVGQLVGALTQGYDPTLARSSYDTLTVIVHGTWASDWWKPHTGDFWKYLQQVVGNCYSGGYPYYWSGDLSHEARVSGAHMLVRWAAQQNYNKLDLVSHSHGGNVCFYATKLGLQINKLFTLGTPIREDFQPDMRYVREIVNVYSTNDKIQVSDLGGVPHCDGRTLCRNEDAVNHRATDDGGGDHPKHSELHEGSTWRASKIEPFLSN